MMLRGRRWSKTTASLLWQLSVGRSSHRRHLSYVPPTMNLSNPSFLVWGAGTDVGKTLISAAYAYYAAKFERRLRYVKPVQTGFPQSSDAAFVASISEGKSELGPHARELQPDQPSTTETAHSEKVDAASAFDKVDHVLRQGRSVSDEELITSVGEILLPKDEAHLTLIETAGGVASPVPSGSLQCDVYRSIRMPCILVGDASLGGITHTLTAYDSLIMRGYEIAAIPMFLNDDLDNAQFIEQLMKRLVHWQGFQRGLVVGFTKIPEDRSHDSLVKWINENEKAVQYLDAYLWDTTRRRFQRMATMTAIAEKHYWWPFTQHKNFPKDQITTVDSRYGQFIKTFKNLTAKTPKVAMETDGEIRPMFDACCSWWTQGVDNTFEFDFQTELVRAVAFGAGRFGHVIFPEVAHEPATRITQKLLQTVGAGWASRVFFSDDGSTAVEVALKMAFGKYAFDKASDLPTDYSLFVLGFSNSYHGDTLGAMEATPKSIFNRRVPWYQQMTKCIDPPQLLYKNGEWRIRIPETWPDDVVRELCNWRTGHWESYSAIEPDSLMEQSYFECCEYYVNTFIDECQEKGSCAERKDLIGACILEPILQGAGGMICIEPFFQRIVHRICVQRDIPVIVDEVFTGFWRLGYISGAKALGIEPDIACFGKLITGGMLPLGVTLASEDVFDAFEGKSKEEALLHGHSYTAYPAACAAAITALNMFHTQRFNPNLRNQNDEFEKQSLPSSFPTEARVQASESLLTNLWNKELVDAISQSERIEGVVAIGTVLAVTLKAKDRGEAGYTSTICRDIIMRLRDKQIYTRPLGNVVYLMVAPNTARARCDWLIQALYDTLKENSYL